MGIRLSFSSWYWRLTLKVLTPILIICIVTLTIINFSPCYYGDYVYPDYIQVSSENKKDGRNDPIGTESMQTPVVYMKLSHRVFSWQTGLILMMLHANNACGSIVIFVCA